MYSLKTGREAKMCPVLLAHLKKQKDGVGYKKEDPTGASTSPSNQGTKRKLPADKRMVVTLPPTEL